MTEDQAVLEAAREAVERLGENGALSQVIVEMKWFDRRGGLGYDTHDALAKWTGILAAINAYRQRTEVGVVAPTTSDEGRCRWPDCQCYNQQGPQTCRVQASPAGDPPAPDVAALIERLETDIGFLSIKKASGLDTIAADIREAITALRAKGGEGDRPTGRVSVEYDGFSGDIIGHYVTREGKNGVVVQQDGTRVVHVYGENRTLPTPPKAEGRE